MLPWTLPCASSIRVQLPCYDRQWLGQESSPDFLSNFQSTLPAAKWWRIEHSPGLHCGGWAGRGRRINSNKCRLDYGCSSTSTLARVHFAGTWGRCGTCRFSCNGRRNCYRWLQFGEVAWGRNSRPSWGTASRHRTSPSAAGSWRPGCRVRRAWWKFIHITRYAARKYSYLSRAAPRRHPAPTCTCSPSGATPPFPSAHRLVPGWWGPSLSHLFIITYILIHPYFISKNNKGYSKGVGPVRID